MLLQIERGKHANANFYWIDFVVNNVDIIASLLKSPLNAHRISANLYEGKIFGIKIKIEHMNQERSGKKGYIKTVTYLKLPMFLGRTYATASNTYYAIDDKTTSMELKISLEMGGLSSLYIKMRKKSIDGYIDRICSDIENAARILAFEDERIDELLDESQKIRVTDYRKKIENIRPLSPASQPRLEASISISMVKDSILVEADALMPDKHFLTGKNEISSEGEEFSFIQDAARQLACINNPAFQIRGEAGYVNTNIEFHQAAFEFGHKLYQDYFCNNLNGIMPVLINYGKDTSIRFDVSDHLEELPWETLHDGKDFIATKLRFSRSLGAVRYNIARTSSELARFGILLIGSDSRGDLPGTKTEVEAIEKYLHDIGVKNIEVLYGPQANRQKIFELILSGQFNTLHFSGHSVFNPDAPYQSYLELAHGTKLALHELDDMVDPESGKNTLNLVFLNSCQSGRIGLDSTTGRNLSMCRILRESGVDNVIGMLWNISDEAATQVASIFYKFLITGQQLDVSEAMRQMRHQVGMDRAWQDGSWLAPVLYT